MAIMVGDRESQRKNQQSRLRAATSQLTGVKTPLTAYLKPDAHSVAGVLILVIR